MFFSPTALTFYDCYVLDRSEINTDQQVNALTMGDKCQGALCPVKVDLFELVVAMAGVFPDISVRVLQRSIIWWIWKTDGKCATEVHMDLLAVFGNDTYSVQTVRSWLREFRAGRDRVHDLERSGRPMSARSEDNVEAVLDAVNQDKTQRVCEIALRVQLSHSSVHRILRGDLNFRKKAAKFVPYELNDVSSIRARYLVHTSRLLFIFFRFFHRKKENCVYLHLESASAYDVK